METHSLLDAKKIEALTGLRFFAAFAIVLAHTDIAFGDGAIYRAVPLHQAVAFFFVLSGFILSHRYRAYESSEFPIRAYLTARFLKIWPVHVIGICLLLYAIPAHRDRLFTEPLYPLAATLNLVLLQSWIGKEYFYSSLNGVAWSISCEMFFYLIFPVLRHRVGLRLLLGVFVATACIVVMCNFAESIGLERGALIYTHPLIRLFEFCLGVFSYRLYRQHVMGRHILQGSAPMLLAMVVVIANLAACQYTFDHVLQGSIAGNLAYWAYCAGGMFSFAALVVVCAANRSGIARLLGWRPLVILGEASFALYMTHAIVIGILAKGAGYWYQYSFLETAAVIFLNSIAVSLLIYFAFERNLKETMRRGRINAMSALLFAVVALMVWALGSTRFPDHRTLVPADYAEKLQAFDNRFVFRFESGLQVDGVRLGCLPNKGIAKVEVAMQTPVGTDMSDALGIHLVDKNGAILRQSGRPLASNSGRLEAGDHWIESFVFDRNDPAQVAAIRLAVFSPDGRRLESVVGEQTEWEAHAALVSVTNPCR